MNARLRVGVLTENLDLTPLDWGAVATIVTALTAIVAVAGIYVGRKALNKAEKSSRLSIVEGLDSASREMLYARAEVRTQVYECVRQVSDDKIFADRAKSENPVIPLNLKTACIKFEYACTLLQLKQVDFTGMKDVDKYPASADFNSCVAILSWLAFRIHADRGGTNGSFDKEEFKKFFEENFVSKDGNSSYKIHNERSLEVIKEHFYEKLEGLLSSNFSPEIKDKDKDPLRILVITELMDLFINVFAYSYECMVLELGLGYSDLYNL